MLAWHNLKQNLNPRSAFLLLTLVFLVFLAGQVIRPSDVVGQSLPINSLSLAPAEFYELENQQAGWQNPGQAIFNDLPDSAALPAFNPDNSAWLSFGQGYSAPAAEPTIEVPEGEAENSQDHQPESPIIEAEAAPAPAVETTTTEEAGQVQPVSAEAGTSDSAEPVNNQETVENPEPQAVIEEAPPAETFSDESQPEAPADESGSAEQAVEQAADEPPTNEAPAEATSSQPNSQLIEKSFVLKDFGLSADFYQHTIINAQLRLSLAARLNGAGAQLKLYYKTTGDWQEGGLLPIRDGLSNRSNSGFFLFALPVFASFEELDNLEIKLSLVADAAASAGEIYVDAAWLEIDYQAGSEETINQAEDEGVLDGEEAKDFELNLISPDNNFKLNDQPDFNFIYRRKEEGLVDSLVSGLIGLVSDPYENIEVGVNLKDAFGEVVYIASEVSYIDDGEFNVRLGQVSRDFRPGKYSLELSINDDGEVRVESEDFSWGVLAMNTSKSVYLPGNEAYLQMGVLDEMGNTICDANLFLEITAPDGGVAYLDTYNGLVSRNPACGANNIIDTPDYAAHYGLAGGGVYQVKLTAHTVNGERTIYDQFEVRETVDFDIERTGPTRIYPLADYAMSIKAIASSTAADFYEVVPKDFLLTGNEFRLNGNALSAADYSFEILPGDNDGLSLHWSGFAAVPGDELEFIYRFDAPDVSPEFYLLGPARLATFSEARQWQIASDGIPTILATNGTSTGAWTTPQYAWNGSNNQRASTRSISATTDWPAKYIKSTANNSTDLGGTITKVEIGMECYVNNTAEEAALRPLFGGTATGTELALNPTTGDVIYWQDVTADAAGPGSGGWTWSDVADLSVVGYGITGSNSTSRYLYIDQLYIRVTANGRPKVLFNSVAPIFDGSGFVHLAAGVADVDSTSTKLKVEYEAGESCNFTVPQKASISQLGTSSTWGAFIVDNTATYQVGTTSVVNGSIYTASGSNAIAFNWDSKVDLPTADGIYCLRLTGADELGDATSTVATTTIDNTAPTTPGQLTLNTTFVGNEVEIIFGSTSADTHFSEYKIFYKVGTSSVSEADQMVNSSSEPALGLANFGGASSIFVGNLLPYTTYVFNIWAYDQYGNEASSTEVTVDIGRAAPGRGNTVYYYGGQWTTSDGVSGQLSDTDQALPSFNFSLAENGASIQNAYIIFEANYNSYVNTIGNYTGYKLAFDACEAPCTANPWSGTGNISTHDTTILSYRSNGSAGKTVRLLLDVTSEAQLAAYRGLDLLQGQVGYNLERGEATTSISSVKAKLVITYKYYDSQVTSYTNTVVYPLESTNTGDTGTRRALQADDCVKNSTCPKFNYTFEVPEISASSSQWFEMQNMNYGSTNADVNATMSIQGGDDSAPYIHEAALNGGNGILPVVYFSDVKGFSENTAQQLEYRAANPATTYNYYILGGEAYETYFAPTSATIKTRTVSFPIGVVSNGNSTAKSSAGVDVFFPENGLGSGAVTIKKAWVRIVSNYYNTTAYNITVSTKVGSNAESASAVYNIRMPSVSQKTAFTIYHLIPASDYAALEAANGEASSTVSVYTTASNAAIGGTAAELMITYAYSSEASGRLSSLDIYGGQSNLIATAQLATSAGMRLVLPEAPNTKTILAGGLLASILTSDSDLAVPGANGMLDANLSISSVPTCTNAFYVRSDAVNEFAEFYKDVRASLGTEDGQLFYTCYSNNGFGDSSVGAKMNGKLIYTYRYDAPRPTVRQEAWRWYANSSALDPTEALAPEGESIGGINLADVLRLRLNASVLTENAATNSLIFRLQYATGTDCLAVATTSWFDLGSSTEDRAWRGFDNAELEGGSSTGMVLLASSTKFETYEENNPSAANPQPLSEGESGEFDWLVYDHNASPSTNYCFRLANSAGQALAEYLSYPSLVTTASNTAPRKPFELVQMRLATSSSLFNGDFINNNFVYLAASTTDVNINQSLRLFFELATSSALQTATTVPSDACAYGTAFDACAAKIWAATSSVGDWRLAAFATTTSITALPENYSTGYKWQALACDNFDFCSDWSNFGLAPNFKIDLTAPTPPGNLASGQINPTDITLVFGGQTSEANFYQYRIFYKKSTTSPDENDNEWSTSSLNYISYNSATSTKITGLTAGSVYAFNIWAYDLAGNKASATQALLATTTSSFTPPTGSFNTAAQRLDGSGGINVAITADDLDNDDTLRAKLEYEAGVSCAFASSGTAYFDPAASSTSATYGNPLVDNSASYRLGTSSGWIMTSPGANFVTFGWLSKQNIGSVEGTYCLRLTVNDGLFDQVTPVYKLVLVDNINPTVAGALNLAGRTTESLTLQLGSTSEDTNFDHYAIYYGTSSPISEADFALADNNLNSQNFNNATSVKLDNLTADTIYYANIFAYDYYGNLASSTQVSFKTDAYPEVPLAINQLRAGGTPIINGAWTTENQVSLAASVADADTIETLRLYFQLIASSSVFTVATSVPSACSSTVAYNDCTSKIWLATSTAGDYSLVSFVATATISGLPDSAGDYKWQVLACDSDNMCSAWSVFNQSSPNFRVDTVLPTAPGPLFYNDKTSVSATFGFGSQSNETNFSRYRLFYATTSPVKETDYEQVDDNLNYINYNSAGLITVQGLLPDTQYYFSLWAYDQAGQAASSSEVSITTNQVQSTPGVLFYAKASQTLFYRVWDGSSWSAEQSGPTLGSAAGDNIRQITVLTSDDKGKVAVLAKTWDGTNQEWWGSVYLMAANSFVNTSQLGVTYASVNGAQKITGCLGTLSSGEFFAVRRNNGTANPSVAVHSWNSTAGWVSQGTPASLNTGATLYGCRLIRRPGTDNHLLMTYDDSNAVGRAYYVGTSTYANSWTSWIEESVSEYGDYVYAGEGFFDPGDNTRGAFYTGLSSTTARNLLAKRFTNSDSSIVDGASAITPNNADAWSSRAVQAQFAVDPSVTGMAYLAGRDSSNQLNVYRLDITGTTPSWSTTTNGKYINSPTSMYSIANYSEKPFDMVFYKNNKALVVWNPNTSVAPRYKILDASNNSLPVASSSVPGASSAIWTRTRLYKDPNDIQLLATFQDTNRNYAGVFWDGASDQFITSGQQAWTVFTTASGVSDVDDEAIVFSFTAGNSAPSTPLNLAQFRPGGTSTIANGAWLNQDSVVLRLAAKDPDTSDSIALYMQLVDSDTAFATTTSQPVGACASTSSFSACVGKTWFIASSSLGDYSLSPFVATATISGLPDSTSTPGYKWQVLACDNESTCSGWAAFNPVQPNFRVDVNAPANPGNLVPSRADSDSITLAFGASTSEANFSRYQISYSTSSPVGLSHSSSSDVNLGYINYNGATSTTIAGLASSTLYYFRIWAFDLAGNMASSALEVSTSTTAGPLVYQVSYVFENDDGADVNSNSTSTQASSTLTNVVKGERLAVRIQLENRGSDIAASKAYKLQFENLTDTPGVWNDIGAATAISYSPGLAGVSGSALISRKAAANAYLWSNGAWHSSTNLSNPISLDYGHYTELAFMLQTANATLGKTYRFRLYDNTANKVLGGYVNYPALSIASSQISRLSKDKPGSLSSGYYDGAYYLDYKGYVAVSVDDNVNYDQVSSVGGYPIFDFMIKNSTSSQAITGLWNGRSNIAASTKAVYLQIFHFGSTNAWETVASNSTSSADSEFTLSGTISAKVSEYYDAFNFVYWRVYQAAGSETLSTDYATSTFANPIATVVQKHYRWRDNNGSETTAAWLEAEDTGSAVASSSVAKGQVVRLRFSAANLTSGQAANYQYRLEYSTTSMGCQYETGSWLAVPIDSTQAFRMSTTTTFVNQSNTTKQLADTEGYVFAAGRMVRDPNNLTNVLTLNEGYYIENEYAFFATANAFDGGTYCFRMSNNGTPLNSYDVYAEITLAGNTNNAPVFIANPTDGGSGTTSPTNYGEPLTFAATAEDADGDDYYLAVCKGAGISPSVSGPPTCQKGSWCISDLASSSIEASCEYTVATSSELAAWYAYACDYKQSVGVAKCSLVSQGGSGDDGDSPFFVNHSPAFTSLSTQVNYQDPGSTFTIISASQDTDIVNGTDTISMFVCKTNSANAAGCSLGGGDTLCQKIAATSSNPSCSFVTPVPAAGVATAYYGFVYDGHGLAATSNSRASSFTVNNVAPSLGTLNLNGGSSIYLNMRGAPDTLVQTVNTSVVDLNGCETIASAVSVIYMSSTTNGYNCSADNNNCYQINSGNCVKSGCMAGGTIASYTCTASLKYYAVPTDNSSNNPYAGANWLSRLQVFDGANYSATTSAGVELNTSQALDVNEPAIDFGANLSPGQNTGVVNQVTTIINSANSPIDTNLAGTDMSGGFGTITVGNLQWKLGSTFNYSTGNALTSMGQDVHSAIVKATSSSASSKSFYWGIGIPSNVYPDAYSGQNTFTALLDSTSW